MRKLQLVTLEYPSILMEGIFVTPIMGSNLNFPIGIIKEVGDIYVKVSIDGDLVNVIKTKLQPVKLYLVDKEEFKPGDWYYYPATPKPKRELVWRDYSARIGRINKPIDAQLFNLGKGLKVIHKPEVIGLTRAKHEIFDISIGDLINVDARVLGRTLNNGGICWIEDELIDGKVVISDEPE